MAANTKYQAAPQRDSFDEPNYTQAPPSYQAESSDSFHAGPRSEDDNLPDDFKVRQHELLARLSLASVILTTVVVRRFCRRSHSTHPHAVHSQSLRHPVSSQSFV